MTDTQRLFRLIISLIMIVSYWLTAAWYTITHDPAKMTILKIVGVTFAFVTTLFLLVAFFVWWNKIPLPVSNGRHTS